MKEKTSEALGLKYVIIEDNFITEDGVKFTFAETKEKDAKAIIALHAERKAAGNLYDYVYAKNNGYIRARRDYGKEVTERTEKVEKKAASAPVIPEPKEKKPITIVNVFRIVMLVVGGFAMSLLVMYSRTFQLDYLSPLGATVMAITMTLFSTAAFEAVFLFWKRSMYLFAFLFAVLWLIIASYSMTSIMSVNFNRYTDKKEMSFVENKDVNSGRLQLDSIDEKKKLNQDDIDAAQATLDAYLLRDKQSSWQADQYRKAVTNLREERKILINDAMKIQEKTPDSVLKKNATKETFYDFLGRLLYADPSLLQFIISILPALFLDLIAPFSIAISIFLEDEDGRSKENS